MNASRKILLVVLAWLGCACGQTAVGNETDAAATIVLENARVAVTVDERTGAICAIRDKQLGVAYQQEGLGWQILTDRGEFRAQRAARLDRTDDGLVLRFDAKDFAVALHYHLGPQDAFMEKWLQIEARDGKPYFLKSVVLEDMTTKAFSDIHFHDDQTIWHCPINLFLRSEKGGCFAGIEYPYWDLKQKGKEGFRLGYTPNYQAAAGETNVSEKYFIGVYRKEGIHRVSQGPYPGRGRYRFASFTGTGLGQHFKGGKVPPEVTDVPPETLDWGEVWAMQEFMRHVLPDDLPLPEKGYWVWQNGWWARLWVPKNETLDLLKQAGIHDVATAHMWYGRVKHPYHPPYLTQMHIDPMGFPKDKGAAELPAGAGAEDHVKDDAHLAELNKLAPGKFTASFCAPPAMDAFYRYGQKIGVHVSSFSMPNLVFASRPEWRSISEDGKVSQYLFGQEMSCPACDPYMDHMLNLLDHVFTRYKTRMWGFDGRWLSYWEGAAYRPGPKGVGLDPCYAKNHGHLPGDNLYKEWKNIQKLLRELRRRHPRTCLEIYYGMHRGGPWALRYFNAAYPFFETHGIVMNRLQAWQLQNGRFNPVYKNTCDLFDTDPRGFQLNVITAISMADHGMMGPAYNGLGVQANRDFLKKWRAWATEHHDYLKVKRDLFGCPGDSPLDGSAHIIKDRGFLFLFPAGGKPVRASIPINRWIQLEEKPDALYRIEEVYPREGTDLGVYRYGEEFLYDMPEGSAVILSLESAASGSRPRRPALSGQQDQVLVVPAFSSVKPLPSARTGEN